MYSVAFWSSLDWYVKGGKSRAFEWVGTFYDIVVHCLMAYSLFPFAVSVHFLSQSTIYRLFQPRISWLHWVCWCSAQNSSFTRRKLPGPPQKTFRLGLKNVAMQRMSMNKSLLCITITIYVSCLQGIKFYISSFIDWGTGWVLKWTCSQSVSKSRIHHRAHKGTSFLHKAVEFRTVFCRTVLRKRPTHCRCSPLRLRTFAQFYWSQVWFPIQIWLSVRPSETFETESW